MLYVARIHVTLRPAINDPQGLTIRDALHSFGFGGVENVRAGKYIEIRLEAPDSDQAQAQATEMSRKLLANPVIEDFKVEVTPAQN